MPENLPEVWLRGPLENIPPLVQPVAHALLQAREELNTAMSDFDENLLWEKPAGVASVAFHLQHLSGVLDRLFTYAKGEYLSEQQVLELADESQPFIEKYSRKILTDRFNKQIELSIAFLQQVDETSLLDLRGVGRKQTPSNVLGLLFHAAEHTMRHLGQLMVTISVLRN